MDSPAPQQSWSQDRAGLLQASLDSSRPYAGLIRRATSLASSRCDLDPSAPACNQRRNGPVTWQRDASLAALGGPQTTACLVHAGCRVHAGRARGGGGGGAGWLVVQRRPLPEATPCLDSNTPGILAGRRQEMDIWTDSLDTADLASSVSTDGASLTWLTASRPGRAEPQPFSLPGPLGTPG